jgi:purine-binding chemotaxis protein CheW
VSFVVDGRDFAAPIEHVRETVALRPITPVFATPKCVAGICNLRGEILAVVDPGPLLGLHPGRATDGRIVVVSPDPQRKAGLWVDMLGALYEIADEDIAPPPPTLRPETSAVLDGVVPLPERPLSILSIDRLLATPELARLGERPSLDSSPGGS